MELEQYKLYVKQYSEIRSQSVEKKKDKLAEVLLNWKETLRTTRFCGYNDITKFYDRYRQFEEIRDAKCRSCTVCGTRTRTYGKEFQDSVEFIDLLEVTQDAVVDYEDLMNHLNDLIGQFAKRVYHIEKVGEKYFHFLDLDKEKYYKECTNIKEIHKFSLVKNDKVTKLPSCSDCTMKLEKRAKWALRHSDQKLDPNVGPPLPDFAFKLRDFGRIPEDLQKLTAIDRTSIAPFTPFTRILKLRNSSGVEVVLRVQQQVHHLVANHRRFVERSCIFLLLMKNFVSPSKLLCQGLICHLFTVFISWEITKIGDQWKHA